MFLKISSFKKYCMMLELGNSHDFGDIKKRKMQQIYILNILHEDN